MKKQYIEVPLSVPSAFLAEAITWIKGIFLTPIYLLMAVITGAPGVVFHLHCMSVGFCLLFFGKASLGRCYTLIFFPMDSTRYFEFQEAWKSIIDCGCQRYLDVSSPRILPLFVAKTTREISAVFINPDGRDLKETETLANALGLIPQCEFINATLENSGLAPESFDLVTCLSVIEHIPQDRTAVEMMWLLLRPGGKLILTLPCMSRPMEQYISQDPYGVLQPGEDGYTFWQRYYDQDRLDESIYSVIGTPSRIAVYGEKQYGLFFRNSVMKRLLGRLYPFWRESYMMATEYQEYSSIKELPGEGVVVLEFKKWGD